MLYGDELIDEAAFKANQYGKHAGDKTSVFTPFVSSGVTPRWGLKYRQPLSPFTFFDVARGKTSPINLMGEGVVAKSVFSLTQKISRRLKTHKWDSATNRYVKKTKSELKDIKEVKLLKIRPTERGFNVSERTWGKLMSIPQFFSQNVRQTWRQSKAAKIFADLNISGDLRQAKWDIANSSNPFKVSRAKDLVSTVSRGNALKLQANMKLRRLATPFIEFLRNSSNDLSGMTEQVFTKYGIEVGLDQAAGADFPEAFRILVTNAAEGSEEAAAMLNEIVDLGKIQSPALYENVDFVRDMKQMFVSFADEADRIAGSQVVARRENYIPHQLDEELRNELRKVAKSGKITGKDRKFKRFSTGAPTIQRGYVDKIEFEDRFIKWMKKTNPKIVLKNAPKNLVEKYKNQFRDTEGVTDLFNDIQLHEPNYVDIETGKKYGSIPEQIGEVMEHHGISGSFFERDPLKFVNDYMEALSRQTATTWTFNDLQSKGVISQSTGWINSVYLPRMSDVNTSRKLRNRYKQMEFMQRRLSRRLADAYEQSEEARKFTVKEIEELEKELSVLDSEN